MYRTVHQRVFPLNSILGDRNYAVYQTKQNVSGMMNYFPLLLGGFRIYIYYKHVNHFGELLLLLQYIEQLFFFLLVIKEF